MEVIQRGTPLFERTFQHTCNHCRSKLKFTAADGQTFTNWRGEMLQVRCPVCSHNFEIVTSPAPEIPRYTLGATTSATPSNRHLLGNVVGDPLIQNLTSMATQHRWPR